VIIHTCSAALALFSLDKRGQTEIIDPLLVFPTVQRLLNVTVAIMDEYTFSAGLGRPAVPHL
jgi:hypothetical protein